MPRPAKIWWHKSRNIWCVKIEGKQVRLSTDKAEAQKLFNKLMVAKDEKKPVVLPVEPQGLLVCEVADKFLAWCFKHRENRTGEGYQEHLQRFLNWLPNGKTMAAVDLKPYHVIDYMDAHEWGAAYKRNAAAAVQRAFKWAVSVGLMASHPCTTIPKPKAGRLESVMSEEQFKAIVANSKPDFADVVSFCWQTGCRPQEVRMIKPEYVQGDTVKFPVKKSKGKRRSRVIYLNEEAKAIIASQPKREWVFVNARGKQWSASNFNNRLERLKKKLGFKAPLYSCRHAYATRKLLEGHSSMIVAEIMGHSSPQMLEQHYAHIDSAPERLKAAIK